MYSERKRDLGFLVGQELTQVLVGRFDVQLAFVGKAHISITGHFRVDDREAKELPEAAGELFPLLGVKIVRAEMLEGADAVISFANGVRLRLLNDSESFEVYRIQDADHDVIV